VTIHKINDRQSFWLDLARGMAAVFVMLGHIRAQFFGQYGSDVTGLIDPAQKAFYVVFGLGHEAVMLFFVMSGLLIAPKFFSADRITPRFALSYSVDRLTRVYVVAIPMLLLSILGAWTAQGIWGASVYHGGSDCAPAIGDLVTNLLFLNNGIVETICSNGPYWSIHNEVFYYFVWPCLVILLVAARQSMLVIPAAVFLIVSVTALLWFDIYDTHNTLLLFPVWLVGGFSVLIGRVPGRFGLWLAAALVALVMPSLIPGNATFLLEAYVLAIVFCGFFIAARDGWSPRPRMRRLAKWLADISFTLYLSHVIFVNLVRTMLEYGFGIALPFRHLGFTSLSVFVVMGAVCMLMAALLYEMFERRTPQARRFVRDRAGLKT
jgi:peptidoglycan/LPS O-acetylase OafA/YrhL